jgi:hypothetical protein
MMGGGGKGEDYGRVPLARYTRLHRTVPMAVQR